MELRTADEVVRRGSEGNAPAYPDVLGPSAFEVHDKALGLVKTLPQALPRLLRVWGIALYCSSPHYRRRIAHGVMGMSWLWERLASGGLEVEG